MQAQQPQLQHFESSRENEEEKSLGAGAGWHARSWQEPFRNEAQRQPLKEQSSAPDTSAPFWHLGNSVGPGSLQGTSIQEQWVLQKKPFLVNLWQQHRTR